MRDGAAGHARPVSRAHPPFTIGRAPGAGARELAAATFRSEQALGTLAGRLVAQGLGDRCPGRGRRIEHHLTP
uniref:hypothetical protein n=1 Tax=Streptomyces sp. SS7 TaxID=3108485 RepID=UPI00403FF3F9